MLSSFNTPWAKSSQPQPSYKSWTAFWFYCCSPFLNRGRLFLLHNLSILMYGTFETSLLFRDSSCAFPQSGQGLHLPEPGVVGHVPKHVVLAKCENTNFRCVSAFCFCSWLQQSAFPPAFSQTRSFLRRGMEFHLSLISERSTGNTICAQEIFLYQFIARNIRKYPFIN